MTGWPREHIRDAVLGTLLGGVVLALLVWSGTPAWLRTGAGLVALVAFAAPFLPILVLIPWHFVAIHQGLTPRRAMPATVIVADGWIVCTEPKTGKETRVRWGEVARARVVRNDNWSQSKMLDDALGLFASGRRELLRVPLDSNGADRLIGELAAAAVPIEHVAVSAPTFLD
jgi:hypothetical protein